MLCLVLLCIWCCVAVWQPAAWLWLVPACLPWLNFSPWTGWVVIEEFDILVLATLASGYGRMAWLGIDRPALRLAKLSQVILIFLAVSTSWALWRGIQDAGGLSMDWFASYSDALNSWRLFKPLFFAATLLPLLPTGTAHAREVQSKLFAIGMLFGLGLVVSATVWERAAFAGVFDFSSHYRTVALFWEMHVGGAALDAYLALGAPFVVWALATARNRRLWTLAAVLAVLVVYAGLTTFSRGVYLAMGLPSVGLAGWLGWRYRFTAASLGRTAWRARAALALLGVLTLEVGAVLMGGSFMSERLARADQDLGSRLVHWRSGVGLLQSPLDWLAGKGLGRLPAYYATQVPGGEYSGAVYWRAKAADVGREDGYAELSGPPSNPDIAGAFALVQRVHSDERGVYRVEMKARVQTPTRLAVSLCERHLLYDRACLGSRVTVRPAPTVEDWQTVRFMLQGDAFEPDPWFGARLQFFSVAVIDAGKRVDLDALQLVAPNGVNLLRNSDFADGLAQWLGVAQSYFDPWHLDNLTLEVLVERGILGLLALAVLVVHALWQLFRGGACSHPLAPVLAAALLATLLLGLVSSVMDVPRVAFLFYWVLLWVMVAEKFDDRSMVDCNACARDS